MKKIILAVVILAAVGIITYKMMGNRQQTTGPNANAPYAQATQSNNTQATTAQSKTTLYLFHNPLDQDEGCRRVYAYADRAEREFVGRVEVKRPDVKAEKSIVDKYQVRVLPTVLLVSSDGKVIDRFEGEDSNTFKGLDGMMERLKTAQ